MGGREVEEEADEEEGKWLCNVNQYNSSLRWSKNELMSGPQRQAYDEWRGRIQSRGNMKPNQFLGLRFRALGSAGFRWHWGFDGLSDDLTHSLRRARPDGPMAKRGSVQEID